MYFKNFPTIVYDAVGDGEFKDVKNLLRRVAIRAKVKTNTLLYDTYDVKEGESPESIADKLYDDPELQYVADKYDNVDGTHHYELAQSSGDTNTKIEVYNNSALYTGDDDSYSTASIVTNREYEENQQDIKRKIRLLDPRYVQQFVEEYETLMKESII